MHRIQLGWNRPEIVELTMGQSAQGSLSTAGDKNYGTSLVLGTPANHVIFERRVPTGYNSWDVDDGIAIWKSISGVRIATDDPLTTSEGNGVYLKPSHGERGVEVAPGDANNQLLVWATNTPSGMDISWKWQQPMITSVVENANYTTRKNITIFATDANTGLPVTGDIKLNGIVVGTIGQPFEFDVLLDFICEGWGNCYVTNRWQTFDVVAPGYTANTARWN
jgi:hypothetical protein